MTTSRRHARCERRQYRRRGVFFFLAMVCLHDTRAQDSSWSLWRLISPTVVEARRAPWSVRAPTTTTATTTTTSRFCDTVHGSTTRTAWIPSSLPWVSQQRRRSCSCGDSSAVVVLPTPTSALVPRLSSSENTVRAPTNRRMTIPTTRNSWSTTSTTTILRASVAEDQERVPSPSDDDDDDDITAVLRSVTKAQLVDVGRQVGLDWGCTNPARQYTKAQLLQRLRGFANDQKQARAQQRTSYHAKVEQQNDQDVTNSNPKERYEIVNDGASNSPFPWMQQDFEQEAEDDDDDDWDDAVWIFPTSSSSSSETATSNKSNTTSDTDNPSSSSLSSSSTTKRPKVSPSYLTRASITVPPPPEHPNKDGERVVTLYNTKDQNDLTGIAAAQPGHTARDPTTGPLSGSSTTTTPLTSFQANPRADSSHHKASSMPHAQARDQLHELVTLLLALSGAPAFCSVAQHHDWSEWFDAATPLSSSSSSSGQLFPTSFVGLDPSQVPPVWLDRCSRALRADRGQVLDEVLRQFEIQAVGQDGLAGDDKDKGGGYYRQVSNLRAFLEGYRRAQVRKRARQTTTLLLDKLVTEGVEGLDLTLATMARSSHDESDQEEYQGDVVLNDSLLDFLKDAIRQQERKVQQQEQEAEEEEEKIPQLLSKGTTFVNVRNDDTRSAGDAAWDSLWNVTTTAEGDRFESLDPQHPGIQQILQKEVAQEEAQQWATARTGGLVIPSAASAKLLLLLRLLKDRLEAEAAFGQEDEKGRNLRLLAYCLRMTSEQELEQLLKNSLGSSMDRVDSFLELVESSIAYGESTSHQLQPSKGRRPLNLPQLRHVRSVVQRFQTDQRHRAAAGQAR